MANKPNGTNTKLIHLKAMSKERLQAMEDAEVIRELTDKYGAIPVLEQMKLAYTKKGKKADAEASEKALLKLWEYVRDVLPTLSAEEQKESRRFLFGQEGGRGLLNEKGELIVRH